MCGNICTYCTGNVLIFCCLYEGILKSFLIKMKVFCALMCTKCFNRTFPWYLHKENVWNKDRIKLYALLLTAKTQFNCHSGMSGLFFLHRVWGTPGCWLLRIFLKVCRAAERHVWLLHLPSSSPSTTKKQKQNRSASTYNKMWLIVIPKITLDDPEFCV